MEVFGSNWDFGGDGEDGGLLGELSTWHRPVKRHERKSSRRPVDMSAGLRQRGASGVSVQVVDLSAHGFRVASHLELPIGTDVWLRLPGLEPYHATVAWQEGHYIGCAFERPLHPAVVDMIVRRAAGNA